MKVASIFYLLLLIIPGFVPITVRSQDAKQLFNKGEKILEETRDFDQAREWFIKSVSADTTDLQANLMAGIALLESSEKFKATKYLKRIERMDSTFREDLYYLIGLSLQSGYQFIEAKTYFASYLNKLNKTGSTGKRISKEDVYKRILECEWGDYYIMHPQPVEIINLGPGINSSFPDYAPVVDKSESVLIFTSRRGKDNRSEKTEDGKYFEDIYASIRKENSWGSPINAGTPINTLYHDSDISLSPDGTKLFLYKDVNEGDIYVSDLTANGWSEPYPFPVLNSPYSERSVSISSDGNTMIFSSNRPGGEGGFDLYRIKRENQYWSKPENLGPSINSKYDEDSPFIDYNDSIIFFSSKGWESMGGFDIFKTSLYDITPLPKNLGYPVNTPEDDIFFVTTRDENRGYFASIRSGGYGDLDIYMLRNLKETFNTFEMELPKVEPSQKGLPVNQSKLESLYFEFGKTDLTQESIPVLENNIEFIKEHPGVNLVLSGHTDNIGTEDENMVLSMERAMKVAILLKREGISETRIRLEAKGECCPIVSNDDDVERTHNRRVEFRIINQ